MKGTLLIVDDEEDVLHVLTEYLTAQGYRVVTAASGLEAVEKLRVTPVLFAAAVVDWTLPDLSGDELVRQLHERQPDCPIIVTTGHSQAVLADTVFGVRAASVVRKPFSLRALATRVEMVMLAAPAP